MVRRLAFFLQIISVIFISPVTSAEAGWQLGTPVPQAVPNASAVTQDDMIYLLSGSVGNGLRRFFEAYDVRGDGWRPLTPLPVDRVQFAMSAGSGQIIATGGRVSGSSKISDGAWMFSPAKGQWSQLNPMPGRRADHVSAIVGQSLYVFGGTGDEIDKIYLYNMNTGLWSILETQMPVPVSQTAIMVKGDNIIIAGGVTSDGKATAIVQSFDTKTGSWRRLPSLPHPLIGAAIGLLDDGIHIFGGYTNAPQKTYDVHYLLSSRGNWVKQAKLPEARHHAGYAVVNNRIFIIGGAVGSGFYALFTATDTVHIYAPK